MLHWCRPTIEIYIAGNGTYVAFLWLASHMTAVKLQSNWELKYLSLTQGLCPNSPDPFSLTEGGVWARDYYGLEVMRD